MALAIDRPRPRPSRPPERALEVRKNCVNRCEISSAGMPTPVSATSTCQPPSTGAPRQGHGPTGLGELDGVRQQVVEELAQSLGIAEELRTVAYVDVEHQPVAAGRRLDGGGRPAQTVGQIEGDDGQRDLPGRQVLEVDEIAAQPRQLPGVPQDRVDVADLRLIDRRVQALRAGARRTR